MPMDFLCFPFHVFIAFLLLYYVILCIMFQHWKVFSIDQPPQLN